ncbi:glucosyltransferase domain-containing protein [Streptococcus equinus]|uniref:glucosyltransferase domain-containing protein n=1 Tax=Streptococcus equinus TaxID=1335 RepID=UPI001FB34F41|nr:glucosyltransferase domain-containing protein [Streptococcus equinus]UOC10495.1 glucosyltransferase domain-containing protein [Streptococcus equinus]
MKTKFLYFWQLNKNKILIIFFLYTFATCSIGIVNYPYIDDIARRVEGVGNFAAHYSRYLSEYASYVVQGSHHLTDTGLTTFVLSAIILTTSSSIVLFVLFKGGRVSWISAFGSIFIGINPWFIECLSFRFDAPYICLSVLCSVLPFVLYESRNFFYFIVAVVGVFLMCNSYQGSSGIFIVMLLTLLYRDYIDNSNIFELIKRAVISGLAYVSAMLIYFIETKFNPELSLRGDTTSIAKLEEMPYAIYNNLRTYFLTLKSQSTHLWLLMAIILIISTILLGILKGKKTKLLSILASILYILTCSIMSLGVYMFFSTPLASVRPRYEYGFAFFIGILMIMLAESTSCKIVNYLKGSTVILLTYYSLSFSFIYASALDIQKESFEYSSEMLATDLNDYLTDENKVVYISSLFKDSPVYLNTQSTYPILGSLIPSNTSLYWPNLLWFKTFTSLDVDLVGFDFNTINMSELELLESNKLWNIYKYNGEIYVYTK